MNSPWAAATTRYTGILPSLSGVNDRIQSVSGREFRRPGHEGIGEEAQNGAEPNEKSTGARIGRESVLLRSWHGAETSSAEEREDYGCDLRSSYGCPHGWKCYGYGDGGQERPQRRPRVTDDASLDHLHDAPVQPRDDSMGYVHCSDDDDWLRHHGDSRYWRYYYYCYFAVASVADYSFCSSSADFETISWLVARLDLGFAPIPIVFALIRKHYRETPFPIQEFEIWCRAYVSFELTLGLSIPTDLEHHIQLSFQVRRRWRQPTNLQETGWMGRNPTSLNTISLPDKNCILLISNTRRDNNFKSVCKLII